MKIEAVEELVTLWRDLAAKRREAARLRYGDGAKHLEEAARLDRLAVQMRDALDAGQVTLTTPLPKRVDKRPYVEREPPLARRGRASMIDLVDVRARLYAGETQASIAKHFGVTRQCIHKLCS